MTPHLLGNQSIIDIYIVLTYLKHYNTEFIKYKFIIVETMVCKTGVERATEKHVRFLFGPERIFFYFLYLRFTLKVSILKINDIIGIDRGIRSIYLNVNC